MKYHTILFDLDGTLTDPGLGITNSILYAMEQMGMAPRPREELYQFIGPPLIDAFVEVFGVTPEQAREMVGQFQVYFREKGVFENQIYPGIAEMLCRLKEAGHRLMLATSKPEVFAEQVLEHFGLRRYFDVVAGSNLDETRTAKAEVIAYGLEKAGIDQTKGLVMVGDRRHDVDGGRANGVQTIGVLYGYGSAAELQEAGVDTLVQTVEELEALLLSS